VSTVAEITSGVVGVPTVVKEVASKPVEGVASVVGVDVSIRIPPARAWFPCRLIDAALADVTETRERTPAPSATTVASATRFVIVFVDMYFLSISRSSLS
jgi:hypothetical protein